jgi:hypothetical protein
MVVFANHILQTQIDGPLKNQKTRGGSTYILISKEDVLLSLAKHVKPLHGGQFCRSVGSENKSSFYIHSGNTTDTTSH